MKFREIKVSDEASAQMDIEIRQGRLSSGPFIEKLEREFKDRIGSKYPVAVGSGTMALKIALDAIVCPGDYVIVPDITFVACTNVIQELGCEPVYVDVDSKTYMLNEQSVKKAMEKYPKIAAIMAVRLAGEEIPDWVYYLGIPVLVDSAHSMAKHDSRAQATCYSFYPTKIVSGIEGGMIATNSEGMAKKYRVLRSFGFTEGTRIAQEVGYKGNMTNISACLIYYNLRDLGANLTRRKEIRDTYNKAFGLKRTGLGMYLVEVDNPDEVCDLIPAIRHYPMVLSEMFGEEVHTLNAKMIVQKLISLPFHEHLVDNDVKEVCATILERLKLKKI